MGELGNRDLSGKVIEAALAVHKALGPGFLESVYENALCLELERRGIRYERQKSVAILYLERPVGEHRLDLLVEGKLVVELKAVKALEDIFFAIGRSYMKAAGRGRRPSVELCLHAVDRETGRSGMAWSFLIS